MPYHTKGFLNPHVIKCLKYVHAPIHTLALIHVLKTTTNPRAMQIVQLIYVI